jgi:hypothetical protein
MERECAVVALVVVVLDVHAQDVFEVAAANDQEPIETLVADGADESLRVGVRLRRLHRRVDHPHSFAAEHLVEGGGELAIAIVDQKPIRSNRLVKPRLRACWTTQVPDGFSVQPPRWTRRLPSSMKNST